MSDFYLLLTWFLLSIGMIVFLTAKCNIHPFFALLLACFVVGCGTGISFIGVVNTIKEGFGNIMRSLGLIIVLGTTLGILLEKSGSTKVMADCIRRSIGKKRPAFAMSITGLIVGFPIFCDSGFIVLSGLNKSLARQTGVPVVIMAVSMATGLYAIHCLVPPHPGAAAAAGLINVEYGRLVLYGTLVAIPAVIAGHLFAVYAGKKIKSEVLPGEEGEAPVQQHLPATITAFLPVVVPILLITMHSFITTDNLFAKIMAALGEPAIALAVGVLLALCCIKKWKGAYINQWLSEAVEKAGGILVIIGAGGAFGAVLGATQIGRHFSESLPLAGMGLWFPFLLTFILKTAQGSSTVAIITAASIVQPLLPVLGFATPESRIYCVLAMGCGSMMVSHANDAYFWVISKFERIPMQPMLRVYSVATLLMGIVSFAMVLLLHLFS
jgi:GntP family gluconate:H+ symporter